MALTVDQAVQQMQLQLQQLSQQVGNLEAQLGASTRHNRVLEAELVKLQQRPGVSKDDTRGGLYDNKLYEPEKLKDPKDFREWSDDFFDFVEMCDPLGADLLKEATREPNVITASGNTSEMRAKAKPLYRMLKRSIEFKQAQMTVVLAPGKNAYEAWRLLHARYAPRNDANAGMVVEKCVDWKAWKCSKLQDVPLVIAVWENARRL